MHVGADKDTDDDGVGTRERSDSGVNVLYMILLLYFAHQCNLTAVTTYSRRMRNKHKLNNWKTAQPKAGRRTSACNACGRKHCCSYLSQDDCGIYGCMCASKHPPSHSSALSARAISSKLSNLLSQDAELSSLTSDSSSTSSSSSSSSSSVLPDDDPPGPTPNNACSASSSSSSACCLAGSSSSLEE